MRIQQLADAIAVDVDSPEETEQLGRALALSLVPNSVVGLVGPLGAGKTMLVKAIAGALGVDPETVSSPTFVLIHEYEGRLPVYHFDAYRVGQSAAFEALGVGEYWEAGGVCLVEWSNLVEESLPRDSWRVLIEPTGEFSRKVTIDGVDLGPFERTLRKCGRSV